MKEWTRLATSVWKSTLRLGQKLQKTSLLRGNLMREQLTHLLGRESKIKDRLNKTHSSSSSEQIESIFKPSIKTRSMV